MRYFSRLESNALGFIFGFQSKNELETIQSLSPTHLIQALKSSTLCCSRESSLMTSKTASCESTAFRVPLLGGWAGGQVRWAGGQVGRWSGAQAMDSREAALNVIEVLS